MYSVMDQFKVNEYTEQSTPEKWYTLRGLYLGGITWDEGYKWKRLSTTEGTTYKGEYMQRRESSEPFPQWAGPVYAISFDKKSSKRE